MKTLDDIKHDKELLSVIRWDMKPREKIRRTGNETPEQSEEIRKQLLEGVGFYFHIEIRYQYPSLYLYESYPDGSGKFVAEAPDAPPDMIEEAVLGSGGAMDRDGRYPVSERVKTWLRGRLEI
ncbi:MAG: DVU0772 family protein [Deltaproteobacteria bacterium]